VGGLPFGYLQAQRRRKKQQENQAKPPLRPFSVMSWCTFPYDLLYANTSKCHLIYLFVIFIFSAVAASNNKLSLLILIHCEQFVTDSFKAFAKKKQKKNARL